MKTKITLLLFSLALLTACSKSCDDDGHEDEILLKEDNYIFEGDLYKYYLTQQIDSLETRTGELQAIIDNNQGTPEIEKELEKTEEERKNTITIEANILGSSEFVARNWPRPFPPRPDVNPIPFNLRYIVVHELAFIDLVLRNEKGEIVGGTKKADLKTLSGTNGELQYKDAYLMDQPVNAPLLLSALRVNTDGTTAKYSFETKVSK